MSKQNKLSSSISVFAVDPGAAGGIAFTDGRKTWALGLDDAKVCDAVRPLISNKCVAYIEQVGGFIGKEQPGAYMFTFGESFGRVQGWFEMAEVPMRLVPPKKWMRAVAPGVLGIDYDDRKRALKQLAQSWHPGIEVTLKTGDALCLLEYAARAEGGDFARPGVIQANTSGNFAADAKAAAKWAKAQGWPIPKRGSKEHVAMVNYYCQNVRV